MCWWKAIGALEWRFGYCTYVSGPNMIRMGFWNGDSTNGPVVSIGDIEWKPY
jgi:hypothetical protein